MDIRKIKKLIELLEESGIAEIEIKEGEEAVRISRMPASPAQPPPLTHLTAPTIASLPAAAAAEAAVAESTAPKPKPSEHVITAPMVGTFYASPSLISISAMPDSSSSSISFLIFRMSMPGLPPRESMTVTALAVSGRVGEPLRGSAHRRFVAVYAEAADYTDRDVREI